MYLARSTKKDLQRGISSLADTADETDQMIPNKNISRFELVPDDYSPGTSGQKRQKIFDYAEEDCKDVVKDIPKHKLKEFQAVVDQIFNANPFDTTPGYVQRGFESAFGFSSLGQGQELRGFHGETTYSINPNWRPPSRRPNRFSIPQLPEPEILVHKSRFSCIQYRDFLDKMTTTGDSQLFDETFTITTLDQSKYDRVSRIGATSADSQTVMTLDVNTELYPCTTGETIHCVLATSLALDGSKDDVRGWRDVGRSGHGGEATLADMFDYVCHGKIYKFEDGEDGQTM